MKTVRRVLRWILLGLLGVVLAAVFYTAVVMGQPSETAEETAEQPLLGASAPLTISQAADLNSLIATFPVPVLAEASQSGLTLQSAAGYDTAFEDGWARVMTLIYLTQDGLTVRLDSIYPARALTLLEQGYTVSATAGHTVAGVRTVRMESGSSIRLHMQTASGLYAVTLPKAAEDGIAAIVRSMEFVSPK